MLEEERDRNMAANNRGHMRPSRSPPFVVVGLLVVICILAFNYWTVSAKNKELVAKTSLLEKEYEATVFKKGALEKRNDVISQDLVGANRKLIEQQKLHATLEERIINLQDENRELKKENDQLAIESHSCRDMLDIVKKNVTETHYQFAELKGVHGDLQKECDVLSQNNVEFHNEKTQLKGDIEICNMELIRCGDAKIALNQTVRELKQQLLLIEQQQHLQHREQNAMQQQREELQQQQDGRQQQQEDRYSEQQQQQQQQQQQYGDQQQQYGNQELQQRQESDQAQQQYQQQQGDENNAGELGRQDEQEDRREEVVNFREPALPAYNFEPKEIQQVNQYDLEPPRVPTDDRYGLERPAFQDYPNPDDQDVNREFPTRQAFPLDNVDKEQDYGNYDELTAALRDQELVDVQREEDSLAQVDGQESEIAASDASHDPPQLPYVLPAYDMPQDMNNQDQIAAQPAEVGDNRLQYQGDTHREDEDRRELDEQGRLPDRDPGMVAMEGAQLEADRQALGGETEQGAEMRRPMLQQPMMQRPTI